MTLLVFIWMHGLIGKALFLRARDKGDLSENAEYDAAKEAQGLLEMRINELKICFLHHA